MSHYYEVFCLFVFTATFADALSSHPVVVILSFDGYPKDFLVRDEAQYVLNACKSHAAPTCLIPAFPTKTHVNHFTLATGLHPEDHGVIDDCVFDRDGEYSENTYEQYHSDKGHTFQVVPLWIENENQGDGRRSGIMMWPGAEFAFQGKKATYNVDYSKHYPRSKNGELMDYRERMKKIFEWIEDEKAPANLVMAYFGELDKALHFSGSFSETTKEKIREVDSFVKDFMEEINIKHLRDKINLIIIGGHIRKNVKFKGIIKLSDYLDDEKFNYMTMGANALVYPNPGDFKVVYDNLKKHANESKTFNVYKQEEIPDRWHLKNSPLLKDKIFLVARFEHCFWGNHEFTVLKDKGERDFRIGADGYDTTDYFMQPIFIGIGPRFRLKCTVGPFHTVDIHPLLKHLLDLIEPASDVQPNTQMSPAVEQMLLP